MVLSPRLLSLNRRMHVIPRSRVLPLNGHFVGVSKLPFIIYTGLFEDAPPQKLLYPLSCDNYRLHAIRHLGGACQGVLFPSKRNAFVVQKLAAVVEVRRCYPAS